jgi:hypothetical protein
VSRVGGRGGERPFACKVVRDTWGKKVVCKCERQRGSGRPRRGHGPELPIRRSLASQQNSRFLPDTRLSKRVRMRARGRVGAAQRGENARGTKPAGDKGLEQCASPSRGIIGPDIRLRGGRTKASRGLEKRRPGRGHIPIMASARDRGTPEGGQVARTREEAGGGGRRREETGPP